MLTCYGGSSHDPYLYATAQRPDIGAGRIVQAAGGGQDGIGGTLCAQIHCRPSTHTAIPARPGDPAQSSHARTKGARRLQIKGDRVPPDGGAKSPALTASSQRSGLKLPTVRHRYTARFVFKAATLCSICLPMRLTKLSGKSSPICTIASI